MKTPRLTGMRAFTTIWLGQMVSLLGSAMTWFAFTIWVWQKTGQASSLAIVSTLAFLPSILFMPIAGTFVDKWQHKTTLILSDFGSASATLIVLLLYRTDNLALWHIYSLSLFAGFFTAFQYPAYIAATTVLVPTGLIIRMKPGRIVGFLSAISLMVPTNPWFRKHIRKIFFRDQPMLQMKVSKKKVVIAHIDSILGGEIKLIPRGIYGQMPNLASARVLMITLLFK